MSKFNPVVKAVSRLDFSGNLVPLSWLQHIRTEHGRVDLGAVIILSEIVFWYRWRIVRDERTGNIARVEQRFRGPRFTRSIRAWSSGFGLTIKQVRRSLATLKRLGVLKVTLEAQQQPGALACLGYEPVPSVLELITYPCAPDVTELLVASCAPGGIGRAPGGIGRAPGGIALPDRKGQKSPPKSSEEPGDGRSSKSPSSDRFRKNRIGAFRSIGDLAAAALRERA